MAGCKHGLDCCILGQRTNAHQAIQALLQTHGVTQDLSSQEPAVWGWDLAKSLDWTVGLALDADSVVCRVERFQRSWEDTIDTIRRMTGSKPALVDSTGVGDPVVERLQRFGPWFEGFRFSAPSKQQLMEGARWDAG